jgi:transcriptional regulator with XRE-family HTH domain
MPTHKTHRVVPAHAVAAKAEAEAKDAIKRRNRGPKPPPAISREAKAIRKLLAQNLEAWMREVPHLDTQVKLSDESGVSQTAIGRILRGEVSVAVDALQQIAKAFGRDASELLASPDLSRVKYDAARYDRLPSYERVRIDAFIAEVIKEHSNKGPAGKK